MIGKGGKGGRPDDEGKGKANPRAKINFEGKPRKILPNGEIADLFCLGDPPFTRESLSRFTYPPITI